MSQAFKVITSFNKYIAKAHGKHRDTRNWRNYSTCHLEKVFASCEQKKINRNNKTVHAPDEGGKNFFLLPANYSVYIDELYSTYMNNYIFQIVIACLLELTLTDQQKL
jgi:hypothetical protein